MKIVLYASTINIHIIFFEQTHIHQMFKVGKLEYHYYHLLYKQFAFCMAHRVREIEHTAGLATIPITMDQLTSEIILLAIPRISRVSGFLEVDTNLSMN